MRRFGLIALALVTVALVAACSDGDDGGDGDLDARIQGLEERLGVVEGQGAEIGALIVLGYGLEPMGVDAGAPRQWCVRYRAFGGVEETCFFDAPVCEREVHIGRVLPDNCLNPSTAAGDD